MVCLLTFPEVSNLLSFSCFGMCCNLREVEGDEMTAVCCSGVVTVCARNNLAVTVLLSPG